MSSLMFQKGPKFILIATRVEKLFFTRGFSNHEWTRMDTKIWSDSPPLVSIRGWFFLAFGWAYADTPVLRNAGTPIRRYAGTPIRSPSVVGVWVQCRTDKASLSEVSVSSTMRVLPAMRTIRAANAVPAINAA